VLEEVTDVSDLVELAGHDVHDQAIGLVVCQRDMGVSRVEALCIVLERFDTRFVKPQPSRRT